MYLALYRQWRPQTFAAVVGQKHVTRTLRHSLKEGRLAHAYLFSGPRGTGKTSTAKIFAKALNCLSPVEGEPCNSCVNCQAINAGTFLDILEIDAASHRRIDDVRELQERLPFGPVQGRYKVYIIDEVHMLTPEAFNALLKTLEEPPAHVVFLLATTEPQKIPQTVLSRCLRFDFRPLSPQEIGAYLKEVARASGMELEERAAWALARMAKGALRDALSLLEECAAYAGQRLTEEDVRLVLGLLAEEELLALGEAVWQGDHARLVRLLDEAWERGKQPAEIVREFLSYLRDLLALKLCPGRFDLLHFSPTSHEELARQASLVAPARIWRAAQVLSELEGQLRFTGQPEVLLELALLEVAGEGQAERDRVAALEERLDRLEKLLANRPGAVVAAGEPPPAPKPGEPAGDAAEVEAGSDVERGTCFQPVESIPWWPQVLELARRKPKVRALLGGVKAVVVESGRLRLGLAARFHKEEIEKQATRTVVEELLGRVLKRPVSLECFLLGETEEAGRPRNAREKEQNVLDEALRLFGGSVLDKVDGDLE